ILREYFGHYVGTDLAVAGYPSFTSQLQYRGVDSYAIYANCIRGGFRKRGDKFQVPSVGTGGAWDEDGFTGGGWGGARWQANTRYAIQNLGGLVSTDVVEATANARPIPTPGSKVFRAAGGPIQVGRNGTAASVSANTGGRVTVTGLSGMSSEDVGRIL